jgi:hypothetical protein
MQDTRLQGYPFCSDEGHHKQSRVNALIQGHLVSTTYRSKIAPSARYYCRSVPEEIPAVNAQDSVEVAKMSTAAQALKKLCTTRGGGSARRLLLWKKQNRRAAAAVASAAMLLPQVHCELTSRRHWPRLKFRALYLWFPHHQERQSPRERHKWILHRGSNFQDEGAAD